jgi:hypothetical protein
VLCEPQFPLGITACSAPIYNMLSWHCTNRLCFTRPFYLLTDLFLRLALQEAARRYHSIADDELALLHVPSGDPVMVCAAARGFTVEAEAEVCIHVSWVCVCTCMSVKHGYKLACCCPACW